MPNFSYFFVNTIRQLSDPNQLCFFVRAWRFSRPCKRKFCYYGIRSCDTPYQNSQGSKKLSEVTFKHQYFHELLITEDQSSSFLRKVGISVTRDAQTYTKITESTIFVVFSNAVIDEGVSTQHWWNGSNRGKSVRR